MSDDRLGRLANPDESMGHSAVDDDLGAALLAEMERRHPEEFNEIDDSASGDNPVVEESGEEESPPAPPSTEEGDEGVEEPDLEMILGQEDEPSPEPTPTPEDVEASEPEQSRIDLAEYMRIRTGREVDVEELDQAWSTYQQIQQWDDATRHRVEQALVGEVPDQPVGQQGQAMAERRSILDAAREAAVAKYGDEGAELAETLLGPVLGELNSVQERLEVQQRALEAEYAQRQQLAQQNLSSQIGAGREQFAHDHPELSETEHAALTARVMESQQLGLLLQQHNNDGTAAMQAALELQYMTDPALRQRAIDAEIARRQQDQGDSDEVNERWNQVGEAGGATPDVPTTMDSNQEPADMRSYIASLMNG